MQHVVISEPQHHQAAAYPSTSITSHPRTTRSTQPTRSTATWLTTGVTPAVTSRTRMPLSSTDWDAGSVRRTAAATFAAWGPLLGTSPTSSAGSTPSLPQCAVQDTDRLADGQAAGAVQQGLTQARGPRVRGEHPLLVHDDP